MVRALNHEKPDRVPLDIGGGSSTSIVVEGFEKLKDHLGVSSETGILNKVFRVARLDDKVLRLLGSDCYPLGVKHPQNWSPPPA